LRPITSLAFSHNFAAEHPAPGRKRPSWRVAHLSSTPAPNVLEVVLRAALFAANLSSASLLLSLSLILIVVASINIYFSLMMLVIDKRKDLSILRALGADGTTLRNIYVSEAFLVAGYGTVAGLTFGAVVCYLQQTVGLVSMGLENAVVANYPVKMVAADFLLILLMNAGVTVAVSWHPARVASRSWSGGLL